MMQAQATPPDSAPTPGDIITVAAALTALLEEETEHMRQMRIGEVDALQDRKLRLTGLMERYMRITQQNPKLMAKISAAEKQVLRELWERFEQASRVNYEALMVARAVNSSLVSCVTGALSKQGRNPVYNARGNANADAPKSISLTLNETI